jgi:serine/threonine protein kinase/Flp pilus assembly protein TadD
MPVPTADSSSSVRRRQEALAARLADELAERWRQGDCPAVEEFLSLHGVGDRPEIAVQLIYEEMCLRRERGQPAEPEEYLRRFPQWTRELEVLFHCHDLFEARPGPPRFPEAGESLGDFQLLAELGRGLHGRVFLATQSALADRPVVLKLTPRAGREHLSLARLQHTHILPLLSAEEDAAAGLLVLCMPYFGGASLAQLLDRPDGRRLQSGQDLLDRLDAAQAASPVPRAAREPARQFLARASAVQAVCWLGACLADALHHAHGRGLVHLDVKPSNVLLTADGQAMLLDFHLAREPLRRGEPAPAWLGGTPAYMSPEQRAALDAVRGGGDVPADVDGRSDVFSLGVLLYELLAGESPDDRRGPLRRRNPDVSVGLADVLDKCLAPEPRDRYRSAAALAADLRRHLADLPLEGVRNRSPLERWRKWRRRKPHSLALWGLLAAVLVATAAATALLALHFGHRRDEARDALAQGRRLREQQRHAEALATLRRGQALADGLPFGEELERELAGEARRAEQAHAAQELHQVADRIRFLYGVDSLPRSQSNRLAAQCRELWDRHGEIAGRLQADLDPPARQLLQADLLDMAILWADLHVRLAAAAEGAAARREALRVLGEAEAAFGPSAVLLHERRRHAQALRRADAAEPGRRAAGLEPRTAWENYALGRALLGAGRPEEADPYFARALDLQPQGLWPNYYRGLCAYRLGRFQEAVMAFSACAALAPESAGVLYNRAGALDALGHADQALRDYDRALRLDPTLAPAALNRGLLHFRAKRYEQAIQDLERALTHAADPATVHYNLALVHLARNDRAAALASVRRAVQADPQHAAARKLLQNLLPSP